MCLAQLTNIGQTKNNINLTRKIPLTSIKTFTIHNLSLLRGFSHAAYQGHTCALPPTCQCYYPPPPPHPRPPLPLPNGISLSLQLGIMWLGLRLILIWENSLK